MQIPFQVTFIIQEGVAKSGEDYMNESVECRAAECQRGKHDPGPRIEHDI